MLYELRGGKKKESGFYNLFDDIELNGRCLGDMIDACESFHLKGRTVVEYRNMNLQTVKYRLKRYIKAKWAKRAKTAKKASP